MNANTPPKFLLRFFKWICNPEIHPYIEGDLLELHQQRSQTQGSRRANLRLYGDVMMLIRPGILRSFGLFRRSGQIVLLKSYFKVSARNLQKHKGYATINIFGLALGLAVTFITTLFVIDELNYDKFHVDSDRIYRITKSYYDGSEIVHTVPFRSYMLDRMKDEIPAIEHITTIKPLSDDQIVSNGKVHLRERNIAFADANFFQFFTFEVIEGSPATSLADAYSVAISEDKAREYFGTSSPIGEVIRMENAYDQIGFDLTVSSVFKNMEKRSHFHYDFLISMRTGEVENDTRGIYSFPLKFGYFKLLPSHSILEVTDQIPAVEKLHAPDFYSDYDMHLNPQPLLDIHLDSHMKNELEANGHRRNIYIFSSIALLTLLIACLNFMNLATARAFRKFDEVSVRKAIGARPGQLIAQFLTDSVLTALLALLVAFLITLLILPYFNAFSGKSLAIDVTQYWILGLFVAIALFTGIISGAYPALLLSRYSKKQKIDRSTGEHTFRKGLIVVQFVISSVLIIATLVISDQWQLLRNQNYSFKSEEIINIPVRSLKIRDSYGLIKTELLKNSNITLVTGSDKDFISKITSFNGLTVPGHEGYVDMYYASIDADFFKLYGKQIISGRNFIDYSGDSLGGIIVNESAAKLIGQSPEDILGLNLEVYSGFSPTVIGVVEDFQYQSLHGGILPLYFQLFYTKEIEDHLRVISLKINTERMSETLAMIETTFKHFDEKADFDYTFLDGDIKRAYRSEENFANILLLLTTIAILIACLGAFGITTSVIQKRMKEIGVRKILGASASHIAFLVNKDFLILVLIANLIAFPITHFLMNHWLQNFASQVNIGVSTFITTILLSMSMAIIGSGYWSLKSALSNPAETLKTE